MSTSLRNSICESDMNKFINELIKEQDEEEARVNKKVGSELVEGQLPKSEYDCYNRYLIVFESLAGSDQRLKSDNLSAVLELIEQNHESMFMTYVIDLLTGIRLVEPSVMTELIRRNKIISALG